eukprot:558586-Rhodomonas_salina.1
MVNNAPILVPLVLWRFDKSVRANNTAHDWLLRSIENKLVTTPQCYVQCSPNLTDQDRKPILGLLNGPTT